MADEEPSAAGRRVYSVREVARAGHLFCSARQSVIALISGFRRDAETSVNNYHMTACNIPEEPRSRYCIFLHNEIAPRLSPENFTGQKLTNDLYRTARCHIPQDSILHKRQSSIVKNSNPTLLTELTLQLHISSCVYYFITILVCSITCK